MKISIVGLGYVGLPLAIEFGKKFHVIGYDVSKNKINQLQNNKDDNQEVLESEFLKSKFTKFTSNSSDMLGSDYIIVAVPTPVDNANKPDMSALINSTQEIAKIMKEGVTIIYEPTVYPGTTEEVCIPILENISGKKWKKDFFVGYSPERINPGDKEKTLINIKKIVSGDTKVTLKKIKNLYEEIIIPGVYCASSIKVAEAAKIIENTQRDLNIALMNELAIIFNKLDIPTSEVLEASETKWNFLPFKPGLVGGHCIGVDPYYLKYKAESIGYHPELISAGRRINDGMANYISMEIIKKMINEGYNIKKAKINILGLTFKENCSDLRNSKVIDMIGALNDFGCNIKVCDPMVNSVNAKKDFNMSLTEWEHLPPSDILVGAVSHNEFIKMPISLLLKKLKPKGIFFDIKSSYPYDEIIKAGCKVWRL